jgi:quercetin dioxygenase-like cupin family protein
VRRALDSLGPENCSAIREIKAMTDVTQGGERCTYVYSYNHLDHRPQGRCSAGIAVQDSLSPAPGAGTASAVFGKRAHVAVTHQSPGSGTRLQSQPYEQFYFVLQGLLTADIDGQIAQVPKHHVLHVPAGIPFVLVVSGREKASFVAVRQGFDDDGGVFDVRQLFSGFSSHLELPSKPSSANVSGRKIGYVYPIAELDAVPEYECSAAVTPRNFVSKKSSSFGAAIHGKSLQVGLIHKGRGSGSKLHTHPNEQFNLVVEGKLVGEIGGGPLEAPTMSLIHMPPGIQHCTMASAEGDVRFFVVKDTSHGMSGPPVDGIEDGPRYLPGFGNNK